MSIIWYPHSIIVKTRLSFNFINIYEILYISVYEVIGKMEWVRQFLVSRLYHNICILIDEQISQLKGEYHYTMYMGIRGRVVQFLKRSIYQTTISYSPSNGNCSIPPIYNTKIFRMLRQIDTPEFSLSL